MPPISEVRTTFTIDLNPFAAGLKTMLSMTQSAGKQITPLLNMQVKAPDYGVFDEQLKGLSKTVDDYIAAQVESAKAATTQTGAMGDLGGKTDDVERKTRKARDATDKHAMSLKHMKRESIETFGAISFLVQNIVQLADNAAGGDQKLEKLSRSMAQGVSAGFGLASTMAMLGVATGGTAAIIGGVVAVGTSLLTFFSNAETRAKIAAEAIDSFNRSLRGGSTRDLQDYRQALLASISAIDKNISSLEKMRAVAALEQGGIYGVVEGIDALVGTSITSYGKINNLVAEQKEKRKQSVTELESLNKQQEANSMNAVEVRKRTLELQIQTEQNVFQQRRLIAQKDYEDEVNRMIASGANFAQVEAATKAHTLALKKIDDEERQEKDQHVLRLAEIDDRRRSAIIDVAEKIELATEKTEIGRLAIQERYATQRLDVEQKAAKRSIELEIKRLQAMGGDEAARKIGRLNEVLVSLDKEFGDKRAAIRSATNEKLLQLDLQNQASIRSLATQALLAQLDWQEKQALASESSQQRRTIITAKFAKRRLEIEQKASERLVRQELTALTTLEGPLTESQQKRLKQLEDFLRQSEALYAIKSHGIHVGATIEIPPAESIAAQLQKIQDLQAHFNRETDIGARERIANELNLEQQKLDRMSLFGQELLEKENQIQERRRQLWAETHQYQMGLVSSLVAGFKSQWDQIIQGQERTSQETIDLRNRENALAEKQLRQEKRDLQEQLSQKKITREEYYDRMEQLDLSAAQRAQSNLEFQKKLDEERRSSFSRAFDAMKKVAFDAAGAILQKQLEAYLIDLFSFKATETAKTAVALTGTATRTTANTVEQASNLTTAASEGVAGTATAARGAAWLPFPFNLIAIAAAIAAATLLFKGIFGAFGFARGGKLEKGQAGFIEGFYPEIIAPEHDFKQVMRTDLIPQFIVEHDRQLNVKFGQRMAEKIQSNAGSSSNSDVLRALQKVEKTIKGLRLETEFDGRTLKAVLKYRNEGDKRIGLKS